MQAQRSINPHRIPATNCQKFRGHLNFKPRQLHAKLSPQEEDSTGCKKMPACWLCQYFRSNAEGHTFRNNIDYAACVIDNYGRTGKGHPLPDQLTYVERVGQR